MPKRAIEDAPERPQINLRAPARTKQQLEEIGRATGLNQTEIIIMAVDKFHEQLRAERTKDEQSN